MSINKDKYFPVSMILPSFFRYWQLFKGNNRSVLRNLQYEQLKSLNLSGKVLDFGGGSNINYTDIIDQYSKQQPDFKYESINIDAKTKPTFLIESNKKFPIKNRAYDFIISLNTLEHIQNPEMAFSEIARCLKSGGKFFFTVPFIFRVHGHPDDFIRGTANFWLQKLESHGFEALEINALSWGPFSTGQSVTGTPGPLKTARKHFALLLDILYKFYKFGKQVKVSGKQDSNYLSAPVGYSLLAVKR